MRGRRVLLGVTGGVAAYKAPLILRLLLQRGADVRVVMTAAASHFVTPMTMEVLSRHRVYSDMFATSAEFPVLHVGLAKWAELVVIAPITANSMARFAHGLADDLLSAIILSTTAAVVAAPSMEEEMLLKPQVHANAKRLQELGFGWLEPGVGELASGAVGQGRMAEPEAIVEKAVNMLARDSTAKGHSCASDLEELSILVTAGPTVEDIDAVRYISNRSSGKMGFATAVQARQRGARVHLITGPSDLDDPDGVEVTRVRSTADMLSAAVDAFHRADAAIMTAAVADYRAANPTDKKIRRDSETLTLELVRNPDIAATLGARKSRAQVVVGFAAETDPGLERARAKLRRKNLDLIAFNDLGEEGAGFGTDTNVVTFVDPDDQVEALPKMTKLEVADRLLDRVRDLCAQKC